MAQQFQLDIITPQRKVFSEPVDSVSAPTPDGSIEILARHQALFTILSDGELRIGAKGKEYFLAIGGGFMEVIPGGTTTVLVSRAVKADEVNEAEIKKAMESAKSLVARKASGQELAAAMTLIQRSKLELKVARRKKSPRPFGSS